jgi:hypothetical protein
MFEPDPDRKEFRITPMGKDFLDFGRQLSKFSEILSAKDQSSWETAPKQLENLLSDRRKWATDIADPLRAKEISAISKGVAIELPRRHRRWNLATEGIQRTQGFMVPIAT